MKNAFKIHDVDSAPAGSNALLANYKKQNGMVPNLFGVMAEAPGLLEGYVSLHKLFVDSSFNAEELTVVWQSINVEHNCTYCVPAHTAIAHMMKVDSALIEALRDQKPLPTDKLQVLQDTTLAMTRKRGELSEDEINRFYAAGYGQRQLLEIVLGLSQKVMSNYVNRLAGTPTDDVFKKFAWQK